MAYDRKKTKRITFDLPLSLFKEISILAEKTQRPMAAMIRVLVLQSLTKGKTNA